MINDDTAYTCVPLLFLDLCDVIASLVLTGDVTDSVIYDAFDTSFIRRVSRRN